MSSSTSSLTSSSSSTSSSETEEALTVSSDENLEQEDNLELTGETIKHYNVICEIGRGSFSIVWLALNILDNKFYALKVQNPSEYKDGVQEIKFVNRLPKDPPLFNNLIENFVENRNKKKYLCSVWNLHCSNLDGIIRKGKYTDGLDINLVRKIMKQLIESIKILHKKYKVFHGDIKPDNILVKGLNDRDSFIIKRYQDYRFYDNYTKAKHDYWVNKGKSIDTLKDMNKETKSKIKKQVHKEITNRVLLEYNNSNISRYSISSKYLEPMNVSLADFGTYCDEDNHYEKPFGTRYYQAPEIILMGRCSYPVDIWAIGCTFYELLSGRILFDPIKDSNYSRDYYHLCLINQTCGKFPPEFIKKTKYYKNFFNSKNQIKDYNIESDNRMDRKIDELNLSDTDKRNVKELLTATLQIDPNKRPTIESLLKFNFFNQ